MSTENLSEPLREKLDRLREKRLHTLNVVYKLMAQKYAAVRENTHFHKGIAAAVVEAYLKDYVAITGRYNIQGRIAKHKIAGLMAASILKLRPIQLVDTGDSSWSVSMDNEMFALLHGLSICAEGSDGEVDNFYKLKNINVWYEDMIYLFKRRPDSAECFSMIFENISLTVFPDNFEDGGE